MNRYKLAIDEGEVAILGDAFGEPDVTIRF